VVSICTLCGGGCVGFGETHTLGVARNVSRYTSRTSDRAINAVIGDNNDNNNNKNNNNNRLGLDDGEHDEAAAAAREREAVLQ